MKTDFEPHDKLVEKSRITTLAYLSYIFNCINDSNLSLQGKTINRFSTDDKIKVFTIKFEMRNNNVLNEKLLYFTNL